jgi:hypothetical protein
MSDDECPFDGGVIPTVPLSERQRRVSADSANTESPLDRVKNSPMGSLSFSHFAKLKSGFDDYSAMKLPALQKAISEAEQRTVTEAFVDDEKSQAACIRWMLRGLDCAKAVRKIRVDLEISAKANSNWKR